MQPPKADFLIVVTLFGIFMLVRDLQPLKALSPIVVTLFGIFMLVRESQSLKAPFRKRFRDASRYTSKKYRSSFYS